MKHIKSGLISRFGVTRTLMALLAIAMSLIGLTVVGLSLDIGMALFAAAFAGAVVVLQVQEANSYTKFVLAMLVSVAVGTIAHAMLVGATLSIGEVGLYALIGLVSSGITVLAFATHARIDRLPGIAHAGPLSHDAVGKMKNHRPPATVTKIHPRAGALAA